MYIPNLAHRVSLLFYKMREFTSLIFHLSANINFAK